VVSLTQLRSLGLSTDGASKRVAAGRLHRVHRGVYAVGRARLTADGLLMAAVLACGPHALVSHRSAGGLHGLRPDNRRTVDITVPGSPVRQRARIVVHGSGTLTPKDRTLVDNIPCTSIARTLLDLAGELGRRPAERAIDQAEVLGVLDLRAVDDVVQRAWGHPGAAVLQAVLADLHGPTLTDQELEERFLALCRDARLPQPEVNAWLYVGGAPGRDHVKVDFLWRAERLVVETDGWGSHRTRRRFEDDRLKDQRLRLAGFAPLRVTARQVEFEPGRLAGLVLSLLTRAA
jgi:hypothetical protein